MILLASMVVDFEPVPLSAWEGFPEVARAVSSARVARSCDLSVSLRAVLDGEEPADPGAALDGLLACDRSGPMPPLGTWEALRLGEAASARATAETDPARAVDGALAVYEFGQALRYGTLMDQVAGLALELLAVEVLEDRAGELPLSEARRVDRLLEERVAVEPRFDLDVEAENGAWMVSRAGLLGWWLLRDARAQYERLAPALATGSEAEIRAAAAELQREQEEAWTGNPLVAGVARLLGDATEDTARVREGIEGVRAQLRP